MPHLLNEDGSKDQKLQGLTSVGIRDAAHQAGRRLPETPIRGGLNQGSAEEGSKAVHHHSGLSRADSLCTPLLSQHSTSDSSENARETESGRERERTKER